MNDEIVAVVTFDTIYYQDYLKLLPNIPYASMGSIVSITGCKPWHDFVIKRQDLIEFYDYFINGDVNIHATISYHERYTSHEKVSDNLFKNVSKYN